LLCIGDELIVHDEDGDKDDDGSDYDDADDAAAAAAAAAADDDDDDDKDAHQQSHPHLHEESFRRTFVSSTLSIPQTISFTSLTDAQISPSVAGLAAFYSLCISLVSVSRLTCTCTLRRSTVEQY